VCIRYRGNVTTKPLPSNAREIFTETLRSNEKGTFTEPLVATIRGIHRDTHAHRQQRDLINLILFFQNKESGLKMALTISIRNMAP
jgi:hypothetical protein